MNRHKNQSYRTIIKVMVFLTLFLIGILTYFATKPTITGFSTGIKKSDCFIPVENANISESVTFCAGTYYLNDTDGLNAETSGAINIAKYHQDTWNVTKDITIDCNGAIFIGNFTPYSKGISAHPGYRHKNITIKNCIFKNYNYGIHLMNFENLKIENCEVHNSAEAACYVNRCEDVIINNYTTYSAINGSGLYLSGDFFNSTNNVTVINSNFLSGNRAGIHFNFNGTGYGTNANIIFRNNYFDNNSFSIDGAGVGELVIQNNTFNNSEQHHIRLASDSTICDPVDCSSKNVQIKNNNFISSAYTDYIFYPHIRNISIFSNSYNNQPNITVWDDNTYSTQFNYNDQNQYGVRIHYSHWYGFTNNTFVTFNYTDATIFNVTNNNITLDSSTNYNDWYDTDADELAYIDTYFVSLDSNQNFIVSDFIDDYISACTLSNIQLDENTNLTDAINLSECFSDPLNATLNYSAVNSSNVTFNISNGSVSIFPPSDYEGTEYVYFTANDTNRSAFTNTISITVNHVIECGDSVCEGSESCSTCSTDCGTCSTPSGGGGSSSPSTPPPVPPNVTINATTNETNETNLTKPEPEPEQPPQVTEEPEPKQEQEPEPEPEEDESIIEVTEQQEAKEAEPKENGALVGQALQKDESITWKGQRSIWISIGTMIIIAALTITTLVLKTKAPKANNQIDMLRLDKKIAQLQEKGLSQSDIKTRLILEGYKPSDIHLEHHVNYYLQLKNWVESARGQGASDKKMSELLRGQGWQESVIREMLKR